MAFDTYVELTGIEGEATAKGFEKKDRDLLVFLGRVRPGHHRPRQRRHLGVPRQHLIVQRDEEDGRRLAQAVQGMLHSATTSTR